MFSSELKRQITQKMDGLFKKTMSYLNSEDVHQDEFVGRVVEVASIKLKILRKIAEGKNYWSLCCYLFWKSPRQSDIDAISAAVGGR